MNLLDLIESVRNDTADPDWSAHSDYFHGFGAALDRLLERLPELETPAHHRTRAGQPATARAAASTVPNYRSGIRGAVASILQAHPDGLTDDEIHARKTGTRHRHSTATRRAELTTAGLVVDTGRTRPNRDNYAAVVWQWHTWAPAPTLFDGCVGSAG